MPIPREVLEKLYREMSDEEIARQYGYTSDAIVMVVSATFPNDSYDYFYIRLGKVDAVYFNNTLAYVKFRE
ncbi:MAG: hypothetical protein QXQ96_10630 [Sulfolobales archaeon]